MFNFFRKKSLPEFKELEASPLKDKYIARTCSWMWLNDTQITVVDKNRPRMITMDPWPQLVYLEATGTKTIRELIYELAKKYSGNVPTGLDSTVLHEINSLLKENIIELKDEISFLPDNILNPVKGK
jgi:hypothetical protein